MIHLIRRNQECITVELRIRNGVREQRNYGNITSLANRQCRLCKCPCLDPAQIADQSCIVTEYQRDPKQFTGLRSIMIGYNELPDAIRTTGIEILKTTNCRIIAPGVCCEDLP